MQFMIKFNIKFTGSIGTTRKKILKLLILVLVHMSCYACKEAIYDRETSPVALFLYAKRKPLIVVKFFKKHRSFF
jgi:hypothetical protein